MTTIRPLRPDERPQWAPLWQGYLDFYKATVAPDVTEVTWARLMDKAEPMHVLGAFEGAPGSATLLGIVHYVFHRSTWMTSNYCYLQDLFVTPAARGKHVGRDLIKAVYAAADVAKCGRVYWLTQETNYRGRELYDKMAENLGFIQYRRKVGGDW